MARDDDIRSPRLRLDAKELELNRQRRRILRGFRNRGVYPVDKGVDDDFAVRVVPVQFGLQVAAESMQPRADVALQLFRPENLGHGPRGLAPPHLELKQPIAGGGKALREEQIRFVPRINVVEPPPIAKHLDRLGEPGDGQRRARRGCADARSAAGDEEQEREKNQLPHGRES